VWRAIAEDSSGGHLEDITELSDAKEGRGMRRISSGEKSTRERIRSAKMAKALTEKPSAIARIHTMMDAMQRVR
jgi:hypothetical protein